MRVLIIVVAVLVLFALVGWITFGNDPGRSSINLETEEIREDTAEMMNQGSQLLNDAEAEVSPESESESATAPGP
jgi:hypothetical protein